MTCVLDASALLRFLFGEAGDLRVQQLLDSSRNSSIRVVMSSVNWGEVVGKVYKTGGRTDADALFHTLTFYGLEVIPVSTEFAVHAAFLKVDLGIPYADAICVSLALSLPDSLLLTADFDFMAAVNLTRIEFIPAKPKP